MTINANGGEKQIKTRKTIWANRPRAQAALRTVYLSVLIRLLVLQPHSNECTAATCCLGDGALVGGGGLVAFQSCVIGAVISRRTRFYLHAVN